MTEILVCDDDLLQAQSLAKTVKLAGEFLAEVTDKAFRFSNGISARSFGLRG